jgi:hypothetical protein
MQKVHHVVLACSKGLAAGHLKHGWSRKLAGFLMLVFILLSASAHSVCALIFLNLHFFKTPIMFFKKVEKFHCSRQDWCI